MIIYHFILVGQLEFSQSKTRNVTWPEH